MESTTKVAYVCVWQVGARCRGLGSLPCESLHGADYVSSWHGAWLPLSWVISVSKAEATMYFLTGLKWLCHLWNILLVTQDSCILRGWGLHEGMDTRASLRTILKDHNQVAPVIPVEVNLNHPVASLTPGMGASLRSSAELPSHPRPQPTPDVWVINEVLWLFVWQHYCAQPR